jgi:mono/diheme cytochrome c family protein
MLNPEPWAMSHKPLVVAALCLLAATGCRQDMHNTPTAQPLRESLFVKNASTARPLVEGTVARGTLQERYDIYCAPCHGVTGNGDGMIVRRGYRQPPSYHIERLRTAPLGHYYDVMTNGFGAMPDYRAQITPRDRWTIAAYVRALQLSQHAPAAEFPQAERDKLAAKPAAPAAPGGHK